MDCTQGDEVGCILELKREAYNLWQSVIDGDIILIMGAEPA